MARPSQGNPRLGATPDGGGGDFLDRPPVIAEGVSGLLAGGIGTPLGMKGKAIVTGIAALAVSGIGAGIARADSGPTDNANANACFSSTLANLVAGGTTGTLVIGCADAYDGSSQTPSDATWQAQGGGNAGTYGNADNDSASSILADYGGWLPGQGVVVYDGNINGQRVVYLAPPSGSIEDDNTGQFETSNSSDAAYNVSTPINDLPMVPEIPAGLYGNDVLNMLASVVEQIWIYAGIVTAFVIGVRMIRRWIGRRRATAV